MWSFDASRKDTPDFDFVAFPPRGLLPVASLPEGAAWCVSLNPKKYSVPSESTVKVKVFPARLSLRPLAIQKSAASVELDYFHVSTEGFGIPMCIIYRPAGVKVAPGATYWVQIDGLKRTNGEDARVEFLVAMFALGA
jgi:hypothetical protein